MEYFVYLLALNNGIIICWMRHSTISDNYDTTRLNFPVTYNNFCSVNITRNGYSDGDFSSTDNTPIRVLAHTAYCNSTLSSIILGNRYSHFLIIIGF